MENENKGKSVILLGSGPKWEECPFDKETWAIGKLVVNKSSYDVNNGDIISFPSNPLLKRTDMLFNMDDVSKMLSFDPDSPHKAKYSREDFIRLINERDVPFITSYACPELIPKSISYPLKEIYEKFGIFYFTNTICFMIAYAIYTGVDSIDLWGIAQGGFKEYVNERRGVEFWLGLASGMGIRVGINGPTQLLTHDKDIVYGYKKSPEEIAKEFGFYKE